MLKILSALVLLFTLAFALDDANLSQDELKQIELQKKKDIKLAQKVQYLKNELDVIHNQISQKSRWMRSYSSYLSYKEIKANLLKLDADIAKISKKGISKSEKDEYDKLLTEQKLLNDQLELLQTHGKTPFSRLLEPDILADAPVITNPVDMFAGFSYIKSINQKYKDYIERKDELSQLIMTLKQEVKVYEELVEAVGKSAWNIELEAAKSRLSKFEDALESISTTAKIYKKRVEQSELRVNEGIENQVVKLVNSLIMIAVLFLIFFLIKQVIKKYITDNERFYMANKILTFINVTLIIMILLFTYIENVSYLVTVLGFASAGIAIAMKDWFMSMLGWLVIVIGGSIHVGDRIRVDMDGMKYVGDVMDISLLRMTLLEDITLTSYMTNRRAGRIIFIPNNYIFTNMIANYSHSSLKTVWDGIDISITFDSNHKKAVHLVKEITRKYSKGYTDITRKQLNKLRNRYSLKNTNVEPRIFTFIEPNGIRISSWYLTNAYATLTLRSTISAEIVDAFMEVDDIKIAYPTQSIQVQNGQSTLASMPIAHQVDA